MSLFSDDMCLLSGPRVLASNNQKITPKRAFPLTRTQEGIWMETQTQPHSTTYNLTLEWDLGRNPNIDIHNILKGECYLIRKPFLQEFDANDVDPEIRVVYRDTSVISEAALTRILRRSFELQNELPARWVILQDAEVFRVYVTAHHIVADGQSMSIISKEFMDLLNDPVCTLPPLADFSSMQMIEKAWSGSETYQNNCEVLVAQVSNKYNAPWPKTLAPRLLKGHDFRKISSWMTFPKSDLDIWSQMYRTSWFRVATTLVGLLVIDKTRPPNGKDEVLSVAFGSRPKEMTYCVGQFANALPVKVPFWQCLTSKGSDRTFKSLVSSVGKNMSAVKKVELFPAVELVRACRSRNVDYKPPKVAVTYSPKLANSECRLFPVEGNCDLFFCFLEYEKDVKLGLIYNPEVISDENVSGMRRQFEQLITSSKLDQISLDTMLGWLPRYPSLPSNDTIVKEHRHLKHIHHWFDAQADSNPTSIALSCHELGTSITYHGLYLSSEHKARILLENGIGRESKVLLNLRRGFSVIEWILATLKAGAAFVYLDPDFSEAQATNIISNCNPSLILNDDSIKKLIDTDRLNTNRNEKTETTDVVKLSKSQTSDDDLAYIIYTSGSTGQPKGVMIEHGSIAATLESVVNVHECGYGTRFLQWASFSFDASVLEWTIALCTGATLCFAQHPKQLIGDYLADVIENNSISALQITPTALETLPFSRELPSLRQIISCGEAPSRETFLRWHPRVNLVNGYGPTEAAVGVSFNPINKTDLMPEALSAGQPTAKTDIYICSEDFSTLLPPGSEGEICLAGPQLARGYCGQPELTARLFDVHTNGVRMYRTGDRGALAEDGSLLILGRIDRELKVRGFRIAPEEIEKSILDAGVGVEEVSVQLAESKLEMVAYVAPSTVNAQALSAALKMLLPAYKVPSKIIAVQSLPKSVSGKTDHKAVKTQGMQLLPSSTTNSPPTQFSTDGEEEDDDIPEIVASQDIESTVTEIWQNILQSSARLSPTVNFFDIGGHSLLVPNLHEKLKSAFPSKSIRLVDLFHQSTIQKQVAMFSECRSKIISPKRRGNVQRPKSSERSSRNSSSNSGVSSPRLLTAGTVTPASSVAPEDLTATPCVAITGISGRFPGAKTADEFYENLLQGRSGITVADVNREVLPGNIWVNKAGVLQDIEDFDHKFWNLSKEDATDMDPQQRLFLEVAYEAFIDAGINLQNTNRDRIGIFVGSANNHYHLHTESVAKDSFKRQNRGELAPSLSARTAYHLNISGPNVTIQVNCASSTVALSQAFDAIRLGRCDTALVGGVSVQLYNGGYITQKGQIFSPRGECNPFDAKADGTVPADAVVAIILKRASDTARELTPTYANILGTAVGSDGGAEKAGYQVPSPRGQAEVIKSAWKVAGLRPTKLKYAEIHGSGTPIGDALELEGLSLAIKEAGTAAAPFTVGSTKGNIGNAQHASGLVSLVKLCKSIQRGIVPATRGLSQPNDMINKELPLRLALQDTPVEKGDLLAVSASGWGGVNSHVVLGFPNAQLQKRVTVSIPPTTWTRTTLTAPRISAKPTGSTTESVGNDGNPVCESPDRALVSLFQQNAAEILKCDIKPDDHLMDYGLDSLKYMALTRGVAKELGTQPIGAGGLLFAPCSPLALAKAQQKKGQRE
ncbi:amino acid adenylation domain protein [Xylaria flabelliformis]|nr:amino acid adenylation domain protein [Xylaria flabelliformis]